MLDPSHRHLDDPLGPFHSFRCFDFGVVCEPDDPREPGLKVDCRPREDSPYVYPVQDFVEFLAALKPDPTMVMLAGIFGDAAPVEVVPEESHVYTEATLNLAGVCDTPCTWPGDEGCLQQAWPAVRLQAAVESFPARYELASVCDLDMSASLKQIASTVAMVLAARPCLLGSVDDPGRCRVFDVRHPRTAAEERVAIAACAETGGSAPCFSIEVDRAQCGATETGLTVQVRRDAPLAPRTHLVVECSGETATE